MSLNKTTIDWPNLSFTWNPIIGCSKNCSYCYAKRLNDRFKWIEDFNEPKLFNNRLDEPIYKKKPATIFVGSMCDIFDKGVHDGWIRQIILTTTLAIQHTFMFLTKLPIRYHDFEWNKNCWLGSTIEDPSLEKSIIRMWRLIDNGFGKRNNNKKFLSIEPILGDFSNIKFDFFDLIIVGADSTPGAKIPPLEWVKSIHHPNIWYKQNIRKYYPELINPIIASVT